MSTLTTASAITCLPPELTDLIVDQLRQDVHALRSCSLVCKAWLARASMHLFAAFRVSCLPLCLFVLDFRTRISTSTRVSWHVRRLEVDVMPQSAADVATLAGHLPRLEALTLLGIGLVSGRGGFEWPAAPCTGRALKRIRAVWLPVDLVGFFLGLFTAVDTLELRGAASAAGGVPGAAHLVRHLHVSSDDDEALPDVGALVDSRSLESLVVDLGRMHGAVAPERVHALLQRAGQHISHFEYVQAQRGWISPIEGIPAFVICSALESLTLTTPSNVQAWRESLAVLASAPLQTQRVRLIPRLDGRPAEDDVAMRDAIRTLDWPAIARALAHCRGLERLEVVMSDSAGALIALGAKIQAREAVLEKMPTWLRCMVIVV